MSVLSVSFKDRLCFEAHNQFSPTSAANFTPQNASEQDAKSQDSQEDKKGVNKVNLDFSLLRTRLNSRASIKPDGKTNHAWRSVDIKPKLDFSPKNHKNSPRSPKMVHDKRPSLSPPVVVGERVAGEPSSTTCQKKKKSGEWKKAPITPSGELDHDGRYANAFDIMMKNKVGKGRKNRRIKCPLQHHLGRGLEACSAPSVELRKEPFRVHFLLSKVGDDSMEKAKERRDFADYPYENPKPFDHRGLNVIDNPDTQLCTTITPRPLNHDIGAANVIRNCVKTDDPAGVLTRNINFKFNTLKGPQKPRYDHNLMLKKEPYPPALSAYNAFLDRIGKSISS